MTRPPAVRLLLLAGACATAALVATPIAIARPRPQAQPEIYAPPPPPPPAGPVALPSRTLADAAAFEAYIERAGAVTPAFANGLSVAQALRDVTANSPKALIRDAVAYGAVAALQDPTFVAAVRAAGTSPDNRRLMAGYLINDARYALLFKGADRAAGLAQQAIGQAGLKLVAGGRLVRQASYDIQHQAWSKEEVANRPDRLRMVESQGERSLPDASDHVDAMQRVSTGGQAMGISAGAISPPYSPLVAEAVQLAAVAALGEASDELYERLAELADDQYGADACLHEAKLNLYQCLAVAKPHYEDMYCMGQHAMNDAGICLVTAAGLNPPPEPPPPAPLPRTAARPTTRASTHAGTRSATPIGHGCPPETGGEPGREDSRRTGGDPDGGPDRQRDGQRGRDPSGDDPSHVPGRRAGIRPDFGPDRQPESEPDRRPSGEPGRRHDHQFNQHAQRLPGDPRRHASGRPGRQFRGGSDGESWRVIYR